jgi:hypothetical protein
MSEDVKPKALVESVQPTVVPFETADHVLRRAEVVVMYQPVIPPEENYRDQIEADKAQGIETPMSAKIQPEAPKK